MCSVQGASKKLVYTQKTRGTLGRVFERQTAQRKRASETETERQRGGRMPGRHRQNEGCVEPKLTRQQAALAGRVLKSLWNPEPSGTPPTDEEKARIHAEINGAFLQAGHTPCYSLRKLGDAISNRMYACRLAQRNKVCTVLEP